MPVIVGGGIIDAERLLSFYHTEEFDAEWDRLGFDDVALARLQATIVLDPLGGRVMAGTGGLRKLRFARAGGGKSGGVRICYALIPGHGVVLLATAYAKNELEDIDAAKKAYYAKIIAGIRRHLDQGKA